jgi:hypothetical protein
MMRLAGVFRPAALIALTSLPAWGSPWLQIAVDPARDVDVGWAEGDYTGDEVSFASFAGGTFVLTNHSAAAEPVAELTISLGEPSRYEMVTLTASSGRTTHLTSVMNPTGSDVLSFDPGFVLGAGESVDVSVDVTPAGAD